MRHFGGDWEVIGGYWGLLARSQLRKNVAKLVFWAFTHLEKFREQETIIILEALNDTEPEGQTESYISGWDLFLDFYSCVS